VAAQLVARIVLPPISARLNSRQAGHSLVRNLSLEDRGHRETHTSPVR